MMSRPAFAVRELWARDAFGECRGVDLAVSSGEVLAVVGDASDGARALVDCLSLAEPPVSGQILLHGVDIAGADEQRCQALLERAIGVVRTSGRGGTTRAPGAAGRPRRSVPPAMFATMAGRFDVVVVDAVAGVDEWGSDDETLDLHVWRAVVRRSASRAPAVVVVTASPMAAAVVADRMAVLREGMVHDAGTVSQVMAVGHGPVRPGGSSPERRSA
jgi:ABC-type glutathione transport system ATPase component